MGQQEFMDTIQDTLHHQHISCHAYYQVILQSVQSHQNQ
jgi:hypothetical protein